METLRINRAHLSRLFWDTVLESTADQPRDELFEQLRALERHREHADYNTGSVSLATGWVLYSLASYFKPGVIAEVGTFIGRSTLALHWGARDAELHTCDISNDIDLGLGTRVKQYPKQSSVEMFAALRGAEKNIDMLHLDGRITDHDLQVLPPTLMFVLDDFEGNEKGVANLIKLAGIEDAYQVVYPPERETLQKYGLQGSCVTAVLMPNSLIRLVRQ